MILETLQVTGTARPILQSFTACTAITGENGSGKSTILNAARAACLGHVPDLGKLPSATIEMATGKELHIAAKFSDGQTVERIVTRTAKGASCEHRSVPTFLEKPLLMLNPAEYFKMTAGEKIRYIFTNTTVPASCTVEGIMEELASVKDEEGTDRKSIQRMLTEHGISDGLLKLTNPKTGYIPLRYTALNSRVTSTIAAVRTLTELKNNDGNDIAGTIAHWTKEMARAQADVERGNKTSGELVAQERMATDTAERRKWLVAKLDEKPMPVDDWLQLRAEAIEANDTHAAVLTKFAVPDLSEHIAAITQERDEIIAKRGTSQDGVDLAKHRNKTTNKQSWLHVAKQVVVDLKNEATELAGELEALNGLECCPHCKGKSKGWKAILEKGIIDRNSELATKITEACDRATVLGEEYRDLCDTGVKIKTAQEASAAAGANIAAIESEIKDLSQRIGNDAARRQQWRDELENLPTVTAADQAELEFTIKQIDLSKAELDDLTAKRDAATRLNQDLKNAEAAHKEHLAAVKQFEVIKAYKAALEAKQASLIEDLFKGLLDEANYFTRGILPAPIQYHDGKIGYYPPEFPNTFVSDTMNNTTEHIVFLAVSCALASGNPYRGALLDKIDFSKKYAPLIMTRLREAVEEGRLDQVIIACTEVPAVPGWEVIELGKEVAA